tara:strand:- start:1160 stop:1348 length:189 start_codon:yes stop_codon:yes gene_type:complete
MSVFKCKQCGSSNLKAIAVIENTVGARCKCGTKNIIDVSEVSGKAVEKAMTKLFIDWGLNKA